ncbi:hypothetical protein QP794_20720 [Paenibacillus sp. UMB7766-LJ446]|uniref:hypothetical protein n=1 Tax=Paenibacillus sp. UMB7766-LJ446 TaxID=3046313 RepID=UPI00254AE117|nr:hypothetical protein [Paenibacillus sp. UMB7766-LJ446]MDK8192513.1 hypothetical protein [Paenibacillus sp. UMB7766-LJ446]
MNQAGVEHVTDHLNHSVIGVVDSTLFHSQYEHEHPTKIVIIQNYYFLKDAAHFNDWLKERCE